jgi:hypothetical protein
MPATNEAVEVCANRVSDLFRFGGGLKGRLQARLPATRNAKTQSRLKAGCSQDRLPHKTAKPAPWIFCLDKLKHVPRGLLYRSPSTEARLKSLYIGGGLWDIGM